MKQVTTIGLLYETVEDARKLGLPLEMVDHWRDEGELDAIASAIEAAGFTVCRIGTPHDFVQKYARFGSTVDFVMTLSVGFMTRYRQAFGAMSCELAQIPYSGPDPYAKLVGQNKHIIKSFFDKMNIMTPRWKYVHSMEMFRQQYPPFPLIIKPACEGTSVGIRESAVVKSHKELEEYVRYVLLELGFPVLVEEFVAGREYKIGYIGNGDTIHRGIIEDVQENGTSLGDLFFHYTAKRDRVFKKVKRDVNVEEFSEIMQITKRVYSLFEPIDYGVFDIRQDSSGKFYIIDFNMDATLHPDKTLAFIFNSVGWSYEKIIHEILRASFYRQKLKWN